MDILAEINRVMELENRALGRLREAVGPAYEKAVHNICAKKGGEGAVPEVADLILTARGKS